MIAKPIELNLYPKWIADFAPTEQHRRRVTQEAHRSMAAVQAAAEELGIARPTAKARTKTPTAPAGKKAHKDDVP